MKKKTNWGLVLLVGVVSAGVALLFAPKSGKELRNDIKNKSMEAKDKAQDSAQNLKQDFKDSYFEAAEEVENELLALDQRQRELNETINSIERDLQK